MPIFHFDIADGVRLEDPVGLDCKSEHEAKQAAQLIARQIAIDGQVLRGAVTPDGHAHFSGTATVNFGDGTPSLSGVPLSRRKSPRLSAVILGSCTRRS